MLKLPDKRPYKITEGVFIVTALISVFLKLKGGDFNIFLTLAVTLSAIGALNWFYMAKRKAYEAAKMYEEILNKFPEDESLLYNCAIAGLISGNKDYALEKFEDFLEKHRLSPLAGRVNKLVELLRQNKKIKQDELCYAGEELRRQGKVNEAEEEFKKELSINYDANWAYYGLGLVYAQSSNVELALENFKKFKGMALSERDIRVSITNKLIKMLKNNQKVDVDRIILQAVNRSRRLLYWWCGFMGFILLLFIYFAVLN